MNQRKWLWTFVFLAIALLCIGTVVFTCKSFDFGKLMVDIMHANKGYLFCALCGMAGFAFFEGLAIRFIANGLSKGSIKGTGFLYSASDIYFSAITPSATGGQPISLYFLVRDGMSTAMATVVLLLNLVMYSIALMVIGLVCILIHPEIYFLFSWPAKLLVIVGYSVITGLAIIFLMLIFREEKLYRIANWVLNILEKLHLLRHREKYQEKLERIIEEYKECADSIKGKHRMLFLGFLCNLLQRASQVSVTAFCYLAIGGSTAKFSQMFCLQGIVAVGSNSVPIPGAMGAVDYLLLQGLTAINAVSHAANMELMSRGISFYLCTCICGIYTLVAYLRGRKGNIGKC